jgi:hypothetical protein
MRYNCCFEHKDSGACKSVVAALTAEEVRSVESLTENADIVAMAYALRHAYREVPQGFLHTEPPALIHPS